MTPIVLIHGGSFAASCWDLLVPELHAPVLAVDLPGRGAHPAAPADVTIATAAASIAADVDAAGFDEIVLAGHSLAGCSMPATIGLLGDRVRHAAFIACTVPDDGKSALDMLPPELREFARTNLERQDRTVLSPEMARDFFGTDLDDAQCSWMIERMTPEAPNLVTQPVDLCPLATAMPRTWIRPTRDAIVAPDDQLRYARNAGECEIIDLDTGHMCMISKPKELAGMLDGIADRV
jgi:pimeloyl-ACP methyl ester carboxylesterase